MNLDAGAVRISGWRWRNMIYADSRIKREPNMKSRLGFCLTAALLTALSSSAVAGVYRCEIGGRVVYQDAPCPGVPGAIKLNPNAAPPPLTDQMRAQAQALRDQRAVATREAAQARQQRLNAILGEITDSTNVARQRICAGRLIEVERMEREAGERARLPYTGNRDNSWRNRANAARERYQLDCR